MSLVVAYTLLGIGVAVFVGLHTVFHYWMDDLRRDMQKSKQKIFTYLKEAAINLENDFTSLLSTLTDFKNRHIISDGEDPDSLYDGKNDLETEKILDRFNEFVKKTNKMENIGKARHTLISNLRDLRRWTAVLTMYSIFAIGVAYYFYSIPFLEDYFVPMIPIFVVVLLKIVEFVYKPLMKFLGTKKVLKEEHLYLVD